MRNWKKVVALMLALVLMVSLAAMSAMAEKDYYTQEGKEPGPYREMLEKGKE